MSNTETNHQEEYFKKLLTQIEQVLDSPEIPTEPYGGVVGDVVRLRQELKNVRDELAYFHQRENALKEMATAIGIQNPKIEALFVPDSSEQLLREAEQAKAFWAARRKEEARLIDVVEGIVATGTEAVDALVVPSGESP